MKKKILNAILITSLISACFAFIPILICNFEISNSFKNALGSLAVILSVLSAFILSQIFSKKIMGPIVGINLENPEIDESYDEISTMLHKITRQNSLIGKQMADLRRRQVEFNTITENMTEGFILIDNKSEILSYNKAALRLLGAQNVKDGEHFISFSRSRIFISTVDNALCGKHGEATLSIGQRVYQLFANPVIVEGEINGAVIVVLDITEKETREEMHREFTSNVSHELKTPLTTISGISEMLMNGIISNEDIPKFSKNIYDEASRLLELINDIIKLSRLDEGPDLSLLEPVDLFDSCKEVISRLEIVAKKQGVEITLAGNSVSIPANKGLVCEMIYNLCDNAVKYNKEGGKVNITVGQNDDSAYFTVSDTGIGIGAEHVDRIFERFYRVDKSHSKKIGGTGLGLSIVKHAAEYHKATLSVDSSIGVGTEITVSFPLK